MSWFVRMEERPRQSRPFFPVVTWGNAIEISLNDLYL
jgi:hypothetical protein